MKITASNNPFIVLYQAMWHYSRGFRYQIPIFLTLLVLGLGMTQFLPYFMGKIINELQFLLTQKHHSKLTIYKWLAVYATFALGFWFLHAPGRILERRFAFRVRTSCLNDLYHRVQSLPMSWHQDHHTGNVLNRIQVAAGGLHGFTEQQFVAIQSFLKIFVPFCFLVYLAWPLAVLCLCSGSIALFVVRTYDQILIPIFKRMRDFGHDLSALLFDYIANIQTIITLRLGIHTEREVDKRLQQQRDIFYEEAKWNEFKWWTIDTLVNLNRVLAIAYIVWSFQHGKMSMEIGLVFTLIQYLENFSGVFFDIGGRYEQIVRQTNDYKSSELIHLAYDEYNTIPQEEEETAPSFTNIEVQNLVFAYKGKQHGRLDHVSLSLHKGQRVALVGASGSGKSTTMKLLRGLYPVDEGKLLIDGVEQPDVSALKVLTTLIPQEPEIFENSIRYNITMGVNQDEADIMRACEISCFDTVLAQLPHGLDTDIREKGVNLSGGQKQRLALARGVFAIQESGVILFDESTSSVDGVTEQRIYNNIFTAFPDKCLVASIHRLHLLNQFHYIYVFDQGRIAQSGTLEDLLAHEGLFKTMWRAYQNAQEPS